MLADDGARLLALIDRAGTDELRLALRLALMGIVAITDADDPSFCALEVFHGLDQHLSAHGSPSPSP